MLLCLSIIGCNSNPQTQSITLSPKELGIKKANEDIKNGTIQIQYYGKPWSVGKPLIDDETGLPVKIIEGCVVTKEFQEEIDAYNTLMRLQATKIKK